MASWLRLASYQFLSLVKSPLRRKFSVRLEHKLEVVNTYGQFLPAVRLSLGATLLSTILSNF